jgi:hypothetical protein
MAKRGHLRDRRQNFGELTRMLEAHDHRTTMHALTKTDQYTRIDEAQAYGRMGNAVG